MKMRARQDQNGLMEKMTEYFLLISHFLTAFITKKPLVILDKLVCRSWTVVPAFQHFYTGTYIPREIMILTGGKN